MGNLWFSLGDETKDNTDLSVAVLSNGVGYDARIVKRCRFRMATIRLRRKANTGYDNANDNESN